MDVGNRVIVKVGVAVIVNVNVNNGVRVNVIVGEGISVGDGVKLGVAISGNVHVIVLSGVEGSEFVAKRFGILVDFGN